MGRLNCSNGTQADHALTFKLDQSGGADQSPDQLGLDAFEERFNGSIVITITFAAHGDFEVMLAEDLLVVMRTVLAAPIAVEDAAFGWHSEGDGHLQRTDRQVTLHAIADGPTDHAP